MRADAARDRGRALGDLLRRLGGRQRARDARRSRHRWPRRTASDAAWRVTASALQVHGGIGFTWEHDLHLWLKRARCGAAYFGDARWHRERVAELSGL